MTEKTIAVSSFFGKQQITREEFIYPWVEHVHELRNMVCDPEWEEEVDEMEIKVRRQAGKEFDRTWKSRNEK